MRSPRLFSVAWRLAQENVQLRPGEQVCVVTDTERSKLAEVFADAAAAFETDPVVVIMAPRAQHDAEVPTIVAAAMVQADIVFQVVTHAMRHTDATQQALRAGARGLVLHGVTEDLMLYGAINADYRQIADTCAQVARWLSVATSAHVRTVRGTDLVMSLAGCEPHVLFAAMPDGETAISPADGSAEGVLVIEHTHGRPGVARCTDPDGGGRGTDHPD